MKLLLVFIALLLATVHCAQTLDIIIGSTLYCSAGSGYGTMKSAFNTTGQQSKLSGAKPYTLFALCDPVTGSPPTWTAKLINYHLVPGLFPAPLADDMTYVTDSGDSIRITKYGGSYWVFGKVVLPLAYPAYFANGTDVTNGVMYSMDSDYVAATPLSKLTILATFQNFTQPSSIADLIFQTATKGSVPFVPPAGGWTLFCPADSAFVDTPQYRKDFLFFNSDAAGQFANAHSFATTFYANPLSVYTYPDNIDIISLSQITYNFNYLNDGTTKATYLVDSLLLSPDQIRADGVVHSIDKYFLPANFGWPLPTGQEFISQFSTFTPALKTELLGVNFLSNSLEHMTTDLTNLGITLTADYTLFLVRNNDYDSHGAITDPKQFNYHILPKAYKLAELPNDGVLTTVSGETIRFNVYNGVTFINGKSEITNADIQLSDGIVHVVTLVFDSPVPVDDTLCPSCYKERTIKDDISNDTNLATFNALLDQSQVALTPPYTLVAPTEKFFTFGAITALDKYLQGNDTACVEFVNLCLFVGSLFPAAAKAGDTVEVSVGGYSFKITYLSDDSVNVVTDENPTGELITVRPRSDGVYYPLDSYLFDFVVTPPPVPEPAPSTDKGPIPQGINPDSAMGITYSLVLLFLASLVLFYQ